MSLVRGAKKVSYGRVSYPGMAVVRRGAGTVARYAGRGLARAIPYVGPALLAGDVAYNAYKYFKGGKSTKKSPSKSTYPGTKSKRSATRRRYNVSATSVSKIKNSGKKVPKKYQKASQMGAVKEIENGGSLSTTSTNAIYPFHGTASEQVLEVAFMAIVKELMRQRKTDFTNWTDQVPYNNVLTDIRVTFRWINDPGVNPVSSTPSSTNYDLPLTGTFHALALAMLDHFKNNSGAGDQPKKLTCIQLSDSGTIPLATIWCNQVNFEYDIVSTMTIQNKTLAEGVDDDRDEADDIENNPLRGYLYTNSGKWANYFDVNTGIQGTSNVVKSTVAQKDTGLCLLNSTNDFSSSGALKKPPPAFTLGFKRQQKIYLMPGEVKKHTNRFKCVISLEKLFIIYANLLGNSSVSTTNPRVNFGFMAGFGLEKVNDFNRSSGQSISIGYEINQSYRCILKYKKAVKANPFRQIGETPINVATDDL